MTAPTHPKFVASLIALATAVGALTGAATLASGATATRQVLAVGAENQYANVIAQIGGSYVNVVSIMSNPNSDPHTFEASPAVAREVANAELVVQNGLGYDSFMDKLEAASPMRTRRVISVQTLLGLPDSTMNPHLWYSPTTMPKVASAIAAVLTTDMPAERSVFSANLARFDASLSPWLQVIRELADLRTHAQVATTEPVVDALLQAAKVKSATPWAFQADDMNGIDPSPQGVAFEENLLSKHLVSAFVYNAQVEDTLTASLLQLASDHHVPVVAVYETMPTPGYDYQTWMTAEAKALLAAIQHGVSMKHLGA